jgi:hypothetical protein
MATKKPVRRKKAVRRGERKRGLTSAIGPKATTALVLVVLAGGLVIGDRLRPSKDRNDDVVGTVGTDTVLAPDGTAKSGTANGMKKVSATVPVDGETAAAAKTPFVTVAGCLERNADGFRLKDTTGADAPKARSWKSGFMKKGSASLDVVDPAHTFTLTDYVGRRVSITGTLTGREMKVKSVRRMSASCD